MTDRKIKRIDTKCAVKLLVKISKVVLKGLNVKIRCSYFPIVMDLIYVTTSLFHYVTCTVCWQRIATNEGTNQTNVTNLFDLAISITTYKYLNLIRCKTENKKSMRNR